MDFSLGVLMTLWRGFRGVAILVLILAWSGCGDTFRPVAVPISAPPPDPSSFHFVLMISENGPNNPGSTTRIDVSGDTNAGEATVGLGPVHATLLPNGSRIYVANSLEDTVSSYALSNASSVTTTSLPAGSVPVFVHTTENGTVYVADSGTGTVAAISTANNVVGKIIAVDPTHTLPDTTSKPVALAETPDGKKLYVVNQGTGSVTSINTVDGSVNRNQTIPTGTSPVWAVARSDNARVYVLNSGDGTVSVIDTSSDTVLPSTFAVGAGTNCPPFPCGFMFYDKTRNHLYVTNPTANTLTALDASGDPTNPPHPPVFVVSLPASPVSVAALPDCSRIYVASVLASGGSATSQVTVINAADGSIRTTIPLGTVPVDSVNPTGCGTPSLTQPLVRFRVSLATAADSSRVYVANCDAGSTAIIHTANDQLMLHLPAPLSDFPAPNGASPPPQNPVFVLAGP